MFEPFTHYLSFGATDQETFRTLEGRYDGIVVPATIAVLQREGTGGFLLSLSAAAARTRYVIDPRTPLYQQALPRVKRAQLDLANVLESPDLASSVPVDAADFTDDRCDGIAERWVKFNVEYRDSSAGKFDKYARRLGQPVKRPNALGPELILAPYFVAHGTSDPWAAVTGRIFQAAAREARQLPVVPVVATENESSIPRLAELYGSKEVIIWVSDFAERDTAGPRLIAYGSAIRALADNGVRPFALYGGFFSICLLHVGLAGFNHGVGFGDARAWRELPESGPPLPRYYLAGAHRYVAPELAQQLFGLHRQLVECDCTVCEGRPPLALDYHGLMQHSVLIRCREVRDATDLSLDEIAQGLDAYRGQYVNAINNSGYGDVFIRRAADQVRHLPVWARALRALGP